MKSSFLNLFFTKILYIYVKYKILKIFFVLLIVIQNILKKIIKTHKICSKNNFLKRIISKKWIIFNWNFVKYVFLNQKNYFQEFQIFPWFTCYKLCRLWLSIFELHNLRLLIWCCFLFLLQFFFLSKFLGRKVNGDSHCSILGELIAHHILVLFE